MFFRETGCESLGHVWPQETPTESPWYPIPVLGQKADCILLHIAGDTVRNVLNDIIITFLVDIFLLPIATCVLKYIVI